MPKQSWPILRTPRELLHWYLRQIETGHGRSCAEALADFEEQKSAEYERFVNFGRTSVDRAKYELHVQRLDTAISTILDSAKKVMKQGLEKGAIIALGSYSPHEVGIVIPPKHWPFLSFDFDSAVATSDKFAFRNVRFSVFSEFSEAQKDEVMELIRWSASKLRQIETGTDPTSNSSRIIHALADIDEGSQAEQPGDHETKIYTRVGEAWAALPEKDKARIEQRGGKTYVAKLIHDQMPEIKFASVEREFRRVFKDVGKSGRKAGT